MADDQHDYKVGPGRPPLHTCFRKGQSRNPGGRSKKKLHALLADALSEQVFVTIDGERRKITKREAVVHQLVNLSATGDMRATKMLFDMIKDVEQKASSTSPARCVGQGGGAKFRKPDTTANPGRDGRREHRGGGR
jgi:hypothetical protein